MQKDLNVIFKFFIFFFGGWGAKIIDHLAPTQHLERDALEEQAEAPLELQRFLGMGFLLGFS